MLNEPENISSISGFKTKRTICYNVQKMTKCSGGDLDSVRDLYGAPASLFCGLDVVVRTVSEVENL
jgi:hypothetical protein